MLVAGCGSGGLPATSDLAAPDGGSADLTAAATADAAMQSVTFRFAPAWSGVRAVTVLGGFGSATDWTMPLLTLTADSSGVFTGTATLPDGQYLYLFEVTGDAAAAQPAAFKRYAIDPLEPDFAACPTASPTYDAKNPNPCSQLTVPQPAAAAAYHITGTVTYDGKAVGGYLVVVERDEAQSHHFFANRSHSVQDGTFDLEVAAGHYRMQVLHPTFLALTDAARDPAALLATRRALSSSFATTGAVALNPAEVAYHDYAQLSPQASDGGEALPTTFHFTVVAGALAARMAVYGPGANIGDPWFASPYGIATSVVFDGGFNTAQATQTEVQPGTVYHWGTWQQAPIPDGGVEWTRESMVLPISFH